ncbi:PTS sugar transporter subunit IIA [Rubinisphaera margarita]|uniref:PTS sugar transporter subunit IIA n=1 Tax=Rubinisphaera margarita TaxID=2909586 RepID=UPI001EE95AD7|nr:PTS sugar transporter subunit IIA [Rubinisphaera margarita]MCG6158396.1 PTS sugar transporter subunit IIA [Rubinisphaera margarita]
MQILSHALHDDAFLLDLEAGSLEEVLSQTLDHLVSRDLLPLEQRDLALEAFLARERAVSTAIGYGVSIPHAYLPEIEQSLVFFVRLKRPINLGAPDGIPTRFFFILLGPSGFASEHLDMLTALARLMSDEEFRFDMHRSRSRKDLLEALERFHVRNTPATIPEPVQPDKQMTFTGKPFGGVRKDIERRLPFYKDDWISGWSTKSASAIVFLFFACLAPAVTFGGIMGAATDGHIGVVEMLIATAAGGMLYSVFAGQPLILLGGVGPMLVFTAILYQICVDLSIPFLPMYQWIGFWTALLLLILAASDASVLMRYFTRFSDDVFSVLMSLIFIYEAIRAIVAVFQESFGNDSVNHDKAFLSLILAIGTFMIAFNLSRFRRSKYLVPRMREFLADFGPTIAIVVMALLAFLFHGEIPLDQLAVPDQIQPTFIEGESGEPRSWIVDGSELSTSLKFLAIIPAILTAVLIFLVQNVTGRLINDPDLNLRKGPAFHLDLLVLSVLVGLCSLFGLPWLVAATVRSLAHVRGLATVEEQITPSGEKKEHVIHVDENRLTAFSIHALIGLSLMALHLFSVTPMAVLYGLFLYMGVVSLSGIQFMERLSLWVMDSSLYPRTHYIRRVPVRLIHTYTLIQLLCLVTLCVINLSPVLWMRLTFPLFIALLVPVRWTMDRLFPQDKLAVLDAASDPEEEETHWT